MRRPESEVRRGLPRASTRSECSRWAGALTGVLAVSGCAERSASLESGPLGTTHAALSSERSALSRHRGPLRARVIATGIPGAGAVTEVGTFHPGSALHELPDFAALTEPGRVFDHRRVLVASTSNFGASVARADQAPGSILSIDPTGGAVAVPSDIGASGGQASALDGRVQLYTAQTAPFETPINTPATADWTAVSLPTGISLNNGSGRPWFSNAPYGSVGSGSITVLNPTGLPTAVFAGNLTNRDLTAVDGITSGALGTAIITKSPDETARPVFAAVMADGSLAQVHVTLGVDGLAPPGTLTPIEDISVATAESTDPSAVARVGIVLNWAPTMNLFVADPRLNRLVVVDLADDGTLFSVAATHEITAEEFDVPIDIAPAVREVASVNFASNTTLGGGSDLYVLNRGSNSIVRMDLAGNVLDVRDIEVDVADYRVNGIGVSSDNQTLYVTATLPNARGMLLAMPAFGAHPMTERLLERIGTPPGADFADVGAALFSHEVTADEGLGPLFNAPSCAGCHSSPFVGGMGLTAETSIRVVGRVDGEGEFDSLLGRGGPFARSNAVIDHRDRCGWPGVPRRANAVSVRSAMTLRGMGLLDAIRVRDVLANQASEPEAVRGRPHLLPDGRLGKFGWKANVASVVEFMGEAYRNEIGLTNPLTPDDFPGRGCRARGDEPGERVNDDPAVDVDALPLTALASFLNTLDPPVPSEACATSDGAQLFASVGCAGCHAPSLPGRSGTVSLYSDLLLHDMGPALADDVIQGDASGSEWRTMPLWRTVERERFLHDGRAATVEEAILLHGGQAQSVRDAFDALASDERNAVLEFLSCI